MRVQLSTAAEDDLDDGFVYYESLRSGLGEEFLTEFRRAVNQIILHPKAWQPLDQTYRRCRLRRFPYGIIYRCDEDHALIVDRDAGGYAAKPQARLLATARLRRIRQLVSSPGDPAVIAPRRFSWGIFNNARPDAYWLVDTLVLGLPEEGLPGGKVG